MTIKWMGGWMDVCIFNISNDNFKDGWMVGWMDERMVNISNDDTRMDGWINISKMTITWNWIGERMVNISNDNYME